MPFALPWYQKHISLWCTWSLLSVRQSYYLNLGHWPLSQIKTTWSFPWENRKSKGEERDRVQMCTDVLTHSTAQCEGCRCREPRTVVSSPRHWGDRRIHWGHPLTSTHLPLRYIVRFLIYIKPVKLTLVATQKNMTNQLIFQFLLFSFGFFYFLFIYLLMSDIPNVSWVCSQDSALLHT